MIKVENVIYEYPGKRALKDISFNIKKGSITALVGPNGAGKTTLMRCIAALEQPFSGDIFVDGINVLENPRQTHQKIGYLSDFFGLYKDLTVRQCLLFIAGIYHIPSTEVEEKIKNVGGNLDLSDYFDTKAGALSRGLKQRLGIAQAILHDPQILLLDEPASGLDPEARISLSKLFKNLQQQGMTLLISSHILSELEDYCSDMLLLREGKIVNHSQATIAENQTQEHKLEIVLLENTKKYLKKFSKLPGLSHIETKEKKIECTFNGTEKELHALLKKIIEAQIPVYHFSVQQKKLQDIYMDHTKEGKNK